MLDQVTPEKRKQLDLVISPQKAKKQKASIVKPKRLHDELHMAASEPGSIAQKQAAMVAKARADAKRAKEEQAVAKKAKAIVGDQAEEAEGAKVEDAKVSKKNKKKGKK